MSGRVEGGHQMFSIEQIELIRRLRNSGITKEEVAQAFDSFDRLDNELGLLYSVPTSLSQPTPVVQPSHAQQRTPASAIPRTNHDHPVTSVNPVDRAHQPSPQTHPVHNIPTYRHQPAKPPVYPVSMTTNTRASSQAIFPERQMAKRPRTEEVDLEEIDPTATVMCVLDDDNSNTSSTTSNIPEEIAGELRDFLKQGIQKVGEEIRWFVNHYGVQLGQIAAMTGQTFATTTQFLQGDYREIPDSCIQAISSWYLAYKKTLSSSTPSSPVTNSTASVPLPIPSQKVKLPDGQEIYIPHQRRERFTFREKHLEVLETCFNENAYPSHEQREAISHMCNMAVSNMGNRALHDREKVTPHMVLNWFANRRKEVKKIAREEGIPESEVVLPSKVYKRPVGFDISMETVTLSPLEQGQCDNDDEANPPSVKSEPD